MVMRKFLLMNNNNRRNFIKQSTIATVGLTAGLQTLGMPNKAIQNSNDKIRMGFIGVGNRGSQLLNLFMPANMTHHQLVTVVY